jgi:hypothetical protein
MNGDIGRRIRTNLGKNAPSLGRSKVPLSNFPWKPQAVAIAFRLTIAAQFGLISLNTRPSQQCQMLQ